MTAAGPDSRGPVAGRAGRARVCLVCEVMHAPFDEGIRRFAANLARALSANCDMLLVSQHASRLEAMTIHGALGNRYFLSARLARLMGSFAPDAILYVPWTSLTARTIVRTWSLRRYAGRAVVGVVALQPRRADPATRLLARLSGPDVVMACGPSAQDQAGSLGLAAVRIGAGVDLRRFRPASDGQRALLRRRAGLDPQACVVLHVGHLKASRNVGVLERVARLPGVACLLVASSSTPAQQEVASRLRAAGVTVTTEHRDDIEQAYRLADVYLFPVTSPLAAIEAPLSVLEAAACDLSIVSTPYGGLPDLLGPAGPGLTWAGSDAEMVAAVSRVAACAAGGEHGAPAGTRRLVEGLSWDRVAGRAMTALERASSRAAAAGGPA